MIKCLLCAIDVFSPMAEDDMVDMNYTVSMSTLTYLHLIVHSTVRLI